MTNTTQHTPAPWVIDTRSGYTDIIATENTTQKVAMIHGEDINLEEIEANAHLIASAPELLEACEMVRDLVRDHICASHDISEASAIRITKLGYLDAAINKAKGIE